PASATCCIPQTPVNFPDPNPGDSVAEELWFGDPNCNTAVTGDDSTQSVAVTYGEYTQNVFVSQCMNIGNLLASQSPPRSGPSGITGGSAEWIVERHPGSNPLTAFSDVVMSSPMAYDATNGWNYYEQLPGWVST